MKNAVLVINYHQINTDNEIGVSDIDKIYSVHRSSFENQIQVLIKNGIPIVTLDDILNYTISSPFSVAITIDDGNISDYEIIFPFLRKNKIKAAFFLPTEKITKWDHAVEMINDGFTIGSHSVTHSNMTKLNEAELHFELEFSKLVIEEKINQKVLYFSVPFGRFNRKIVDLVKKAGYKAMLTTDVKLNYPENNNYFIHRWSIKSTTTISEFERMILDRKALKRKIIRSGLKQILRKLSGKHLSDKLNLLIFKVQKQFNGA